MTLNPSDRHPEGSGRRCRGLRLTPVPPARSPWWSWLGKPLVGSARGIKRELKTGMWRSCLHGGPCKWEGSGLCGRMGFVQPGKHGH